MFPSACFTTLLFMHAKCGVWGGDDRDIGFEGGVGGVAQFVCLNGWMEESRWSVVAIGGALTHKRSIKK